MLCSTAKPLQSCGEVGMHPFIVFLIEDFTCLKWCSGVRSLARQPLHLLLIALCTISLFCRPWMLCICRLAPLHLNRQTPLRQAICIPLGRAANQLLSSPLLSSPLPNPHLASLPLGRHLVISHHLSNLLLITHLLVSPQMGSRVVPHLLDSHHTASHPLDSHPLHSRPQGSHLLGSLHMGSHLLGSPCMDSRLRRGSSRQANKAAAPVTTLCCRRRLWALLLWQCRQAPLLCLPLYSA